MPTVTLPNGAGYMDYEDVNVDEYTEEEFDELLAECEEADFSGATEGDR